MQKTETALTGQKNWALGWQLFLQWNVRSALATPWRTSLTVLGIALGVAVVLAMNAATWSAMDAFKAGITEVAGSSNWEVVPTAVPSLDEHLLRPLYALEVETQEAVKIAPILEGQGLWVNLPLHKTDPILPTAEVISILGVDMVQNKTTDAVQWVVGQSPTDWFQLLDGTRHVLVGERLAQRHGLKVGSRFSLLINTTVEQLQVTGVLQAKGVGGASGGDCIIGDLSTIQPLLNQPNRLSRVSLIVPKALEATILPKIKHLLPASTVKLQPPQRRGQRIETLLKSYQINLTALSLIALLVGAFLIYNTLNVVMVRRKPELATLLVMGTPKRLLQLLLLAEATVLGMIGSVAGLGLGLLMLAGMSQAVSQTLQAIYTGVGSAGLVIPWWLPWVAVGLGIATTWVGAYFPTKEALAVQPAEAVRPQGSQIKAQLNTVKWLKLGCFFILLSAVLAFLPSIDGIPLAGYIATKILLLGSAFCLPWVIKRSIAWLQPKVPATWVWMPPALALFSGALNRTATACASVMVAIALLVSLSLLIGSFRSSVQLWVLQSLKADLFIQPYTHEMSRGGGQLTDETVALIRSVPSIEAVDNFLELDATYQGQPYKLGLGRMDLFAEHGNVKFVNGESSKSVITRVVDLAKKPSATGVYGAIISEPFAMKHHLVQGDVLSLPTPKGTLKLAVEGIYFDYASEQGYVIIPRQLYERYDASLVGQSTSASVYIKPSVSASAVKTQLLKALPPTQLLSIRTNKELREEVLRVFDQTFAITYVMQAVALGIALLTVLNTLWTLVLESQQELAILKVLGFKVGQIRAVVLMQALLLALFGGGGGLIVGCGLAVILVHVLNYQSFGWTVPLQWSGALAIQTVVGVCLGALLGGWSPAQLAVKASILKALRSQ
jgi:putative ABC transport system permease protein